MRTQGGARARIATICPMDAESCMSGSPVTAASATMGTPSAPYRYGGVVGDRGNADGVEIGDAHRNQDRRHNGPRVTEPDQPLQQRAEGPRKEQCLHPDIGGAAGREPGAEVLERAGDDQSVEQDHAPEGDPVHRPDAGHRAEDVGGEAELDGHSPDHDAQHQGNDRADQGGQPRRHPQHRKQDQQQHHRDQCDQSDGEHAAERVENLVEHVLSFPRAVTLPYHPAGNCLGMPQFGP